MSYKRKSIIWGIFAGFALAVFYLAVMFLTMPTVDEIWDNIRRFWYLIMVLIIGFGVQIGLWAFLKNCGKNHGGGVVSGASGITSGGAMVACCAHHLADILPIIGLTGAAIFLAQYQKPFLILSVAINLFGVAYMLNLYSQHLASQKIKERGGEINGEHHHEKF